MRLAILYHSGAQHTAVALNSAVDQDETHLQPNTDDNVEFVPQGQNSSRIFTGKSLKDSGKGCPVCDQALHLDNTPRLHQWFFFCKKNNSCGFSASCGSADLGHGDFHFILSFWYFWIISRKAYSSRSLQRLGTSPTLSKVTIKNGITLMSKKNIINGKRNQSQYFSSAPRLKH